MFVVFCGHKKQTGMKGIGNPRFACLSTAAKCLPPNYMAFAILSRSCRQSLSISVTWTPSVAASCLSGPSRKEMDFISRVE